MTNCKGTPAHAEVPLATYLNILFNKYTPSTSTPSPRKIPAIPAQSMVSVVGNNANDICVPPYAIPLIRVRISPPAMTDAICPETLTLMEYISKKFWLSSARPI